jgi:3',5'-cyclic AMP phosphodiesterase CpdA
MTRIVHISDLHFGKVDAILLDPLVREVHAQQPSLVVISGDLTQRARPGQFAEAREFLQRLPQPQLVVPGNHDIPLYNTFARFFRPLRQYKRYITDDLHPYFGDANIAVLGLNTARSLTTKYGRINRFQLQEIRRRFRGLPETVVKVVVTHHPFDLPENANTRDLVGRAEEAMAPLSECGVDLLLAGHMHLALAGNTSKRYKIEGYSAIFVQAGTATSTRGRGEPNSYNVLEIQRHEIVIQRFQWHDEQKNFVMHSHEKFARGKAGWERLQ